MTLLAVNMGRHPDDATLAAALAALPEAAPVVIMLHGFRFSPDHPDRTPHRHILSLSPRRDCWKAVSWPRHLGMAGDAGLAIAYGWPARGHIWAALARADQAATDLARLVTTLRRLAPNRPLHLVGHSLGARVALLALRGLRRGAVDRLILISAALFRGEARAVLAAAPAADAAEIVNVTGRENLLFDALLRLAAPLGGRTVAAGVAAPNWLDVALDRPTTLAALAQLGYRIAPPRVPVCHWSGYLRPGVFGFYRAVLLQPRRTPLPALRTILAPRREPRGRRWTALKRPGGAQPSFLSSIR
jgi:pimeloyl-ACP methyl ester carboxylesterase